MPLHAFGGKRASEWTGFEEGLVEAGDVFALQGRGMRESALAVIENHRVGAGRICVERGTARTSPAHRLSTSADTISAGRTLRWGDRVRMLTR